MLRFEVTPQGPDVTIGFVAILYSAFIGFSATVGQHVTSKMILTFETLCTEDAFVSPLTAVYQLVLSQGTRTAKHFATCWTWL